MRAPLVLAAVALCAAVGSGCAAGTAASGSGAVGATTAGLPAVTAQDVVTGLRAAGLPTGASDDVTQQYCPPAVGCSQAISATGVIVRSFPNSGRAEKFAGPTGAYQIINVTLTFDAAATPAQRQSYEAVAARVVS